MHMHILNLKLILDSNALKMISDSSPQIPLSLALMPTSKSSPNSSSLTLRNFLHNFFIENNEDFDDNAASYANSYLFEFNNLSTIGIDMYREELLMYETTHIDTNRAIASDLIL